MKRRTKILIAGVAAVVIALAGVGIAAGGGLEDDDATDTPITGAELEQATDAALEFLGEGTVTETEVNDEESKYEVEVTLDNGDQVDVQLDEEFNVVGSETDGPGEDED
jgi:hypothetical protein